VDGRVRRGELNRQAIIDATLELVGEKGSFPTVQAIAERAGVSKRSVFHHFPDTDALLTETAERQAHRHWHILERPLEGSSLGDRISRLAADRAELFEAIGDVRRVAVLHEPQSDVLATKLGESRQALKRHLTRSLAPEIDRLPREVLDALEAVTSWETWEVLRRLQGLSPGEARRAVESVLQSAFATVTT
jgi:TetR/AcrR family transcriptional regulator of autoinduction and epiphytic fitness